MDDAKLDLCLRVQRADGLGKALEAIDTRDQNVPDTTILQLGEDVHPELRSLALANPQSQKILLALEVDAQGQVHRLGLNMPTRPKFQVDRIQVDDRLDRIQRLSLPGFDILQNRIGYGRDQGRRNFDTVELV